MHKSNLMCANCGKAIFRHPHTIKNSKTGLFFCSIKCRSANRKNLVEISCANCGKVVLKWPSHIKNVTNSFCSTSCHYATKKDNRIDPQGYSVTSIRGKNRRIHRIVMETYLGRVLSPNELVHHIDGNKLNNDISNLAIFNRSKHALHHRPRKWCIETAKKLVKKGFTIKQVGEQLNITPCTISNTFRTYGISVKSLRK